MNEQILELADKAIEDMPGAWNIPNEFCKKFAELIVLECIDQIKISSPDRPYLANQIKKRFGIEE
jgi:hypothetical protein